MRIGSWCKNVNSIALVSMKSLNKISFPVIINDYYWSSLILAVKRNGYHVITNGALEEKK